MDRLKAISVIRDNLNNGRSSIGSWMQLASSSVAEIMGQAGYDWVAVDLEHGAISVQKLPDLFRALELGDTLPIARLAQGHQKDCLKWLPVISKQRASQILSKITRGHRAQDLNHNQARAATFFYVWSECNNFRV